LLSGQFHCSVGNFPCSVTNSTDQWKISLVEWPIPLLSGKFPLLSDPFYCSVRNFGEFFLDHLHLHITVRLPTLELKEPLIWPII
jgi:hypothetical protein